MGGSIEPALDKIETESEAKKFADDNAIHSEKCRLEELNAVREPEVGKDGMDVDGLENGQECRNSRKENIDKGGDSRNSVLVDNGKEPSIMTNVSFLKDLQSDSFEEKTESNENDNFESVEISTASSKDLHPPTVPDSNLDDSGFSDMELSDIVSVPSDIDVEKNTNELICRLASKTKHMLLSPKPESLGKDKSSEGVGSDPVESIESSLKFSSMMKMIADNMAQLEENKISLNEKDLDHLESNHHGVENDLLSDNELDLVVEDI